MSLGSIMYKSDMFETRDWASFQIVCFQFLQHHIFVAFSSYAFAFFN